MLYICCVPSDSWCLTYKYDLYKREVDTLNWRCKIMVNVTELFIFTHLFMHSFTFNCIGTSFLNHDTSIKVVNNFVRLEKRLRYVKVWNMT